MSKERRVLIIGAGTSGIASAKNALAKGFEVYVYEQTKKIGGVWNYTDETGVDDKGIPQFYMYKDLKTNVPKEIMRFTDYDYQIEDKSFLNKEEVLQFLRSYAEKFNIPSVVQFERQVIRVLPIKDRAAIKWEVLSKDLQTDEYARETFDFVIVCNGINHCPKWPEIKGRELFQGMQKHSFDFRHKEEFQDKKVLVIGSGPSAMDISVLLTSSAKEVILAHRIVSESPVYLGDIIQKPVVKEITENGAIFTDDSTCTVDAIIYCTGFKYSFPFLSTECGIFVDQDNYVQPIFKQCISIKYPSMAIIGLNSVAIFQMSVDLQSQFALEMWSKGSKFPTAEEMLKDSKEELEKKIEFGWKKTQAHWIGEFTAEYNQGLADLAGIPTMPDVYVKIFNKTACGIKGDFLNYRKDLYKVVDDKTYEIVKGGQE